MKCIVFGCTNHKDQGKFMGDICYPCYLILTTGKAHNTTSILKTLKQLEDYGEKLGMSPKSLLMENLIESHENLRDWYKEYSYKIMDVMESAKKEAYKQAYEDVNKTDFISIEKLKTMSFLEVCELIAFS